MPLENKFTSSFLSAQSSRQQREHVYEGLTLVNVSGSTLQLAHIKNSSSDLINDVHYQTATRLQWEPEWTLR
jgi:hypothetical protein